MSIVERLYNIMKSVVQEKLDALRSNEPRSSAGSYSGGYRQEQRSSGYSNPGSSQSHEDPELARCYANLEIPYGSDYETVHRAWKKMVRQYHPDMHSGDDEKQRIATELVQGLNEAHDILKKHLT